MPKILKACMILVLCGASLIGVRDSYDIYLRMIKEEPTETAQVCQWAMERDYQYVYGGYWDVAPLIAAHSDGALTAGCWHMPADVFQVLNLNVHQDIYGDEENKKAIYVFDSADEESGLKAAQERGVQLTKMVQIGDLRVYTSPVQLMKTNPWYE